MCMQVYDSGRASVNGVAMKTLKVIYPNVLDVGCFSHTLDHVGGRFQTPNLSEFATAWLMLFAHSPKAKLLWKEQTGRSMATYSATRWWSKWEVLHQLMVHFGDVEPFLRKNEDVGPSTRQKLLSFFDDSQKTGLLKLELAAVIDYGEAFVKATYNLEGDGPLAFTCYEEIQAVDASIHVANSSNVQAVAKSVTPSLQVQLQLEAYAKACVKPGLDYLKQQEQSSLKAPLAAFKAARLFCPDKINLLRPTAADIDSLLAFPFLDMATLSLLKEELPTYLATAEGVACDTDRLLWWKMKESKLPAWASAVKKVLLAQPSSAASERVFSLLKSGFGEQQDNSLQDYLEASVMLRYNN